MSQEDNFGFTHLVEEDDGDDIANFGKSYLDLELQPHLSTFNQNKYVESTDLYTKNYHADTGERRQLPTTANFEKPLSQLGKGAYDARSQGDNPIVDTINNVNSSAAYTKSSNKINLEHSEQGSSVKSSQNGTNGAVSPNYQQSKVHIQYSATEGKVNVMQGQVVTRSDGSRYIDTQDIPQLWLESERPLRQRKMKLLKIFSILACIVFFPFGIPAVYFAFKTEKEFHEGIMKGNIDRAQKFAKRTEKFIIISFIMALVIVALVVTVVVRKSNTAYVPRGPVGG